MSSNIERLESILQATISSITFSLSGEVTCYFECGLAYKNLQSLLKQIGKGLDYTVVFEQSQYKYSQDGILQQPKLVCINKELIVRDGIYVSWIDIEQSRRNKEQELREYINKQIKA